MLINLYFSFYFYDSLESFLHIITIMKWRLYFYNTGAMVIVLTNFIFGFDMSIIYHLKG